MKKDLLRYKDFIAEVHFSTDDNLFYGKIEGINDLVTFEGESVKELQKGFKEAVEDYLKLCAGTGKKVHKSYKGSFNVRMNSELHRKAVRIATEEGVTLNQFVQKAVEHEVKERESRYGSERRYDFNNSKKPDD